MLVPWLEKSILDAALALARAGSALHAFDEKVAENLKKMPIQEWEADRWMRGVKLRMIRMETYFFRAGAGKRSATSLFVRNEDGLNVGFRREAITQMATYITLVTDYGFGRKRTRFESQWMDVAVYDGRRPLIYAENKASARVLEKLRLRLEGEFAREVPWVPEPPDADRPRVDDAVMKAHHIWRHRPAYFWAVCPTARFAYRVVYGSSGFTLAPLADVPAADAAPLPPPDPLPEERLRRRAWAPLGANRP